MGGYHFKDYYWLLSRIHISYYRYYHIQFFFLFVFYSAAPSHNHGCSPTSPPIAVSGELQSTQFQEWINYWNLSKQTPPRKPSYCTSITTSIAPASSAAGPMCSRRETSLRSCPQASLTPRHASAVEPVSLVFTVMLVGGGGESDRREWVSSTGTPKDAGLSQLAAFPVTLLSHRRRLDRQRTCVDLLIIFFFFP